MIIALSRAGLYGDRYFCPVSSICTKTASDARLADKIVTAIDAKAEKNHDGKEKTVLILDYRTNFPTKEGLLEAMAELSHYFAASPFLEIWLYHGYFSDDDGNNAEFSFAPLKLPEAQALRFEELAVERGVDKHGRIVWQAQQSRYQNLTINGDVVCFWNSLGIPQTT